MANGRQWAPVGVGGLGETAAVTGYIDVQPVNVEDERPVHVTRTELPRPPVPVSVNQNVFAENACVVCAGVVVASVNVLLGPALTLELFKTTLG